jgi:serine protease AprX
MNGRTTPNAMAANFAANKGIAVVCAAGNLGATKWRYVGTPADADSVLAVGAVDPSGFYANFSSHGPASSGQVKPAVSAQGQGSVVADWNSNGTLLENGTSFASPILCGLVTCLLQAHPKMKPLDLFHFIEQSANQYSKPDTLQGYGKPDFCAANLTMGIESYTYNGCDAVVVLSPNPFVDNVKFVYQSHAEQDLTIILSDISGRLIRKELHHISPFDNNALELSGLDSLREGMYLLTFQTQGNLIVRKIVKGQF